MEAKYTYCTKMHKDVIQTFYFIRLLVLKAFPLSKACPPTFRPPSTTLIYIFYFSIKFTFFHYFITQHKRTFLSFILP